MSDGDDVMWVMVMVMVSRTAWVRTWPGLAFVRYGSAM